jgi:hypothetical protein
MAIKLSKVAVVNHRDISNIGNVVSSPLKGKSIGQTMPATMKLFMGLLLTTCAFPSLLFSAAAVLLEFLLLCNH